MIFDRKRDNSLIFIGSLDKTHNWKGLDSILLSIKKFVEIYSKDISLLVIGEGNWKNNYIKLVKELHIEKHVKFLGMKKGGEKNMYLRKAKLAIIYPKTSNDALPTVLLEAWAYSLPVIGSNIQPISKIIKNKVDGLLVSPNSPDKLAPSIHTLLKDNELRKKLSTNGYQKIKATYLLENQVIKFNKLLTNN